MHIGSPGGIAAEACSADPPERCQPKVFAVTGGAIEQFEAAQRRQPRQAFEIAANAESAIAGKIPLRDRTPAGRRTRPATGSPPSTGQFSVMPVQVSWVAVAL